MDGNPLLKSLNTSNMMNAMQNNPAIQLLNIMRSGGNPMQLIGSNPKLQQINSMMNGKSDDEVGGMMSNLAKEKGVDLGQLAKSLGMPEDVAKRYGIKF